jgi:hypothetical protein
MREKHVSRRTDFERRQHGHVNIRNVRSRTFVHAVVVCASLSWAVLEKRGK